MKVAFAIPRKDVCIEIYSRLKNDYKSIKIVLVCGGNTSDLEGQIVVLTTHQLYRYKHYFDLLILDEADAFPYYGDKMLNVFLHESVIGPIIYLSATIKDSFKKKCNNIVYVNRRFHNYDLPVPIYKRYLPINKYKILEEIIKKLSPKKTLIFVPTIEIGKKLASKYKYPFVYSSLDNKQDIINKFKKDEIRIMITTSILERGVTFLGVQVIVFEANHELYDTSSLIQIAGRVGRKIKSPTGCVYFLSTSESDSMKKCIKEIKKKNDNL